MADLRVSQPASGARQTIPCAPDTRFLFDFSTAEATMTRDGDNLVFTFDDGGAIELSDFYATYDKENIPDFVVDGVEIAGADFFMAMNEPDLMPAAGPAAGAQQGGARFHDYANSSLAGGIDHLDGLDLQFGSAVQTAENWYGAGEDAGNRISSVGSGAFVPPSDPVIITPEAPDPSDPSFRGGSLTVHDSGLTGGSREGQAATTASGSLNISAPDGVRSIELDFGGKTVNVNTDGSASTLDTGEGTLTVSYADGRLNYEYTLTGAAQHGRDQDSLAHDITVRVTDTDGDEATSAIRINIMDDAAKAENDSDAVTRYGETQATGNVLTNDAFGADGPEGGVKSVRWNMEGATPDGNGGYTVETDYGTLTLAADGKYSFTLNNNSEALIMLQDRSATLDVPYTITDADGDTSDATLTLTINGENNKITVTPGTGDPFDPDFQGESATVHDSGLTGGSREGQAATTASGSLNISAPDGVRSIELAFGGKTVNVNTDGSASTLDTGEGTLTVSYADGRLNYEYTLTGAAQHGRDQDSLAHDITVRVTDTDGDEATSAIRINIVDDAAKAENDSDAVTRYDETLATGNVLDNDSFGADGPEGGAKSVHWNMTGAKPDGNGGYTVNTDYGTLTLAPDGTYSFALNNNSEALINLKDGSATLDVPYTITDADGDASDATLTLTINGENNGIIVQKGSSTVYEAGLKGGTQEGMDDAPTKVTGDLDISAPDGVKSIEVTFGQTETESAQAFQALRSQAMNSQTVKVALDGTESTLDTDEGILTVSFDKAANKLHYEYELKSTVDHDHDEPFRDFTVTVTDTDGDEATSTIRINIVDDAPVAGIDSSAATQSVSSETPSSQLKFYDDASEAGNGFVDAGNVGAWEEATPIGNYIGEGFKTPVTYKGFMDGVKIIATTVRYEGGDITLIKDMASGTPDQISPDKHLYNSSLTGENNGLTVGDDGSNWKNNASGKVWNADEIGLNPKDHNYSEAVVLEAPENTVSYGLKLELGSLTNTDRVLVTFMSTPQNNNDDIIVKQVYVDVSDLQGDPTNHWAHFDVPQGFTKVFISAVANGNGDYAKESGFTLREVELLTNSAVNTGRVDVDYGADGTGKLTWDLSENDWTQVQVINARGHGTYGVTLEPSADGLTVTGKLAADGALLDKHTLFTATLNPATGEWTITKFYEFTFADGTDLNLKFIATDTDESTRPITDSVPTTSEERLDRFDDVDTGYYNEKWESDASKDNAVDVMAGNNGNDLMYGKGGNDIISGDGGADAIEAIGDILDKNGGTTTAFKYFAEHDGYDANGTPIKSGWLFINNVQDRIEQAIKGNPGEWGRPGITPEKFADKLAAIEKEHPEWNGDDALFGGRGDDILFGWGGNDYLNGGEGEDMIFAGGGDDLILYDKSDYLVHGGSGIDFLLSGRDDDLHLKDLLGKTDANNGPMVRDVEVLLKGDDIVTLTHLQGLEDYDIRIDNDTLILGKSWTLTADGQYTYEDGRLILETTLTGQTSEDGTTVFQNTPSADDSANGDPYAIPEEAMTFMALSSRDDLRSDGEALQDRTNGDDMSGPDALTSLSGYGEAASSLFGDEPIAGLEGNDSLDAWLGSAGGADAADRTEADELPLDLTNMNMKGYRGLGAEQGEAAPVKPASGAQTAGVATPDGAAMSAPAVPDDHVDESAIRAAMNTIQSDTGGC